MVSLLLKREELAMTITMTSKNQITIPKKIVQRMGLKRGSIFDIKIEESRIELVPMELVEKGYTDEEYKKMEEIYQREKHTAKPITQAFLNKLKKGKI
jgi:AbrB family looped-hinge helix DNA binding protein